MPSLVFEQLSKKAKKYEDKSGNLDIPQLDGVDARLGWATSYGYARDEESWRRLIMMLFGSEGFNPEYGIHHQMVDQTVFENRSSHSFNLSRIVRD